MTAVAAIRSAAGHELLTPKAQSASASGARRDLDVDFIDKHFRSSVQ
jgi:hypothetical protein